MIYLLTSAGAPNFGDDAILLYWLRWLRKARPELPVIVDCLHVANVRRMMAVAGLFDDNIQVVDTVWRMTDFFGASGCWEGTQRFTSHFNSRDWNRHFLTFESDRTFSKVSHFHFLGGGYLDDNCEKNLVTLTIASALKSRFDFTLIGTGMGISLRLPQLRFDCAPALSDFDYLSTRDPVSAGVAGLAGHSPEPAYDDIVLGLPLTPQLVEDDGAWDVCLQRDNYTSAGFGDACCTVLSAARRERRTLAFWEMLPSSDGLAADFLLRLNPGHVISLENLIADAMTATVRSDRYCIGSRFHFHYVNSWFGRTGCYFAANEYYEIKHESIRQIGSNWQPFGKKPILRPTIDRAKVHAAKISEAERLYGASTAS